MKKAFYNNIFNLYKQAGTETRKTGLEYWRAILNDAAKTNDQDRIIHAARMIAAITDANNI